MSEAEVDETEVEEEEGGSSGPPVAVLALVAALVFLVAISGMFAIGFIPPLKGGHDGATTVTSTARGQFFTVTTTIPAVTQTVDGGTVTANATTVTSTVTGAGGGPATATVTQVAGTSTQTLYVPIVSTLTNTITTTSVQTITSTSTTTTTPTDPVTVNITIPPSTALYAADSFVIDVSVVNRLPNTNVSLYANEVTSSGQAQIITFFPSLPETMPAPIGTSDFKILGTLSPHLIPGQYEIQVLVAAASSVYGYAPTFVNDQFLMQVGEPLTFTSATIPTSSTSSSFKGACAPTPYGGQASPTWIYECNLTTAPGVNGTIDFTVTNLSNSPICIQTQLGSSTLTGYVDMNPYPFCPGGGSGVYVPANVTSWTFTYLVESGGNAGSQTVFFTFSR